MWEILSETRLTEDCKPYTAFGLKRNDFSIADIFTEKAEAARFAETLNKHDVSVVHIFDVLEDYFGML